jgi:hypothetical protein
MQAAQESRSPMWQSPDPGSSSPAMVALAESVRGGVVLSDVEADERANPHAMSKTTIAIGVGAVVLVVAFLASRR